MKVFFYLRTNSPKPEAMNMTEKKPKQKLNKIFCKTLCIVRCFTKHETDLLQLVVRRFLLVYLYTDFETKLK